MQLLFDERDLEYAEERGDLRLEWLRAIGAIPLQEHNANEGGFLFGYQIPSDEYAAKVREFPRVCDRPSHRDELARLEDILSALNVAGIDIPTPRTWVLRIDDPPPLDLTYPLFVRTSTSSWKRGGQISKVWNLKQLQDECELLRRAFRWDSTILAREWVNLATAGEWRYGSVPVELRVWIIDAIPHAWSFHYLHAVSKPKWFPPKASDLHEIAELASLFAQPFSSRLIAADFVLDKSGGWQFLEAGPGACSGTAHESVFKTVASKLAGYNFKCVTDDYGGLLQE